MSLTILKDFHATLINFVDELIGQFPQEGDLIVFRIFIKDKIPIHDLVIHLVSRVANCRDKLDNRDERFFLEEESMFEGANKSKILNLKTLWRSPDLDSEDKACIWQWVISLIGLADKYVETF
jgi:hypothetical protein